MKDKLTGIVTQNFVNNLSGFFETEAGKGIMEASYVGNISVGVDILGQEYFLNGGALTVARTQGGLDNLIEDGVESAPRFRDEYPTAFGVGKAAALLLIGAGLSLGCLGCGDDGGGENGTTGAITGMSASATPNQIEMGEYVTVDGSAGNTTSQWHETDDASWSGNNLEDFYPDASFAGKQAMKFFGANDDTTDSIDYHFIVKYNLESAEEQDTPADFATNPDLIPQSEFNGFWKGKLSAGAQADLDSILALYNPSDLDENAWGANADGVYLQLEVINEVEVDGYTDNTGDAQPDYVARFTPASFPTLAQGTVDELNALLNAPPADRAAAEQLIYDLLEYKLPTAVLAGPFSDYYMTMTGLPIDVETQALYLENGNPVAINATVYPGAQESADILDEKNQNGELAGTYTGESHLRVLPTDSGLVIDDQVDFHVQHHEDNN